MNFIEFLKHWFISLVIFLGLDVVWLGVLAKKLYDNWLSPFERTVDWLAVILTYGLLLAGLNFFVIFRFAGQGPSVKAVLAGAFYGLVVYGVYDLTNLATLKRWSPAMSGIDMIWGAVVCGITTWVVLAVVK